MNVVTVTGNLTDEITVKTGQSGKDYCNFSLAVKRLGNGVKVDYLRFAAFGQTAVYLASYAKKGDKIVVNGVIQNNQYEKEGKKMYVTNILVKEAEIAGKQDLVKEQKFQAPLPSSYYKEEKKDEDFDFLEDFE